MHCIAHHLAKDRLINQPVPLQIAQQAFPMCLPVGAVRDDDN